jgi:hypothetical protein
MDRSIALFEDRYGAGSFDRLTRMLDEPCTTFATIAEHFGVTRERVRQWHLQWRPGAPRGHERKHLCMLARKKKTLLQQPLFRTFYQHAREHFGPGRFALLSGSEGFRSRVVGLDGQLVSIRKARSIGSNGSSRYVLSACHMPVDFVYYDIGADGFLFVPRTALPAEDTSFRSDGASPLTPFHNSFEAAFARSAPERRAV